MNQQKLTKEYVQSHVKSEQYHHFEGTNHTVCCLTLANGFTVIGESIAAQPEDFDVEKGRRFARVDAEDKVWAFVAYALRLEQKQ